MPQPKLSGHFGGCLFWFVRWGEVAILFLRKVKNCQINGWKFTWNLPVICQEFMWFPNCTCKNMSSVARFITPFIWIGFTNSRQKSVPTCTKSFKTFQGLAKFKTKGISTNSARPKMFKEKTSKNHLISAYDFRLASIKLRNVTFFLNFRFFLTTSKSPKRDSAWGENLSDMYY